MSEPAKRRVVRILHVEDEPDDSVLVGAALERGGIEFELERVDTRPAFVAALETAAFDIVLSDYSLPAFDGFSALAVAGAMRPHLPFIFVSGTMGEDTAVEALHRGASDYVLKDRLARLPASVIRALDRADERRRLHETESRLHESEERFRLFMDASPVAALLKDAQGKFLYVNRAVEQFLGKRSAEVLGKTIFELFPRGIADTVYGFDMRVVRGETIEGLEIVPAIDGSLHHWSVFKFPIDDAAGRRLVAGMAIDVTERTRLEERYLHAQKMEAVGRLAGGVAHDFNNLLTVIGGYADMLGTALSHDAVLAAHVGEIRSAAERASALTRQLLAFSRQEVVQPVLLDLDEVMARIGNMLRRLIGEDVQLDIVSTKGLGSIRADRGQLEQVLMNLVVNARDAMPSGGTITIRTADVPWEALGAEDEELQRGPYVMLSVTDTGDGMTPQVLAKIFEPFFTTKGHGAGTGLGLATVHGIVKQSGGHVRVKSAPGCGATFEMFFPRVEGSATRRSPTSPGGAAPGGTETVVVAEDNAAVRALVAQILRRHGYTVVTALDGADAARKFDDPREPIHLLVTDMVMPHVSGSELAERVRARHPALPVVFMTGYADRGITSRIAFGPTTALLGKPFTADTLLRKVRDTLDAARGA